MAFDDFKKQTTKNSPLLESASEYRYVSHVPSSAMNHHVKQQNQQPSAQPAIACSKLTIETLEQGVKYVQS